MVNGLAMVTRVWPFPSHAAGLRRRDAELGGFIVSARKQMSRKAAGPILAAMALVVSVVAFSGGPARAARIVAKDAHVALNDGRTDFVLRLSDGVTVEVFTLANPYRVILDMPDVAFALPEGAGRSGKGLVKAFRYGLFAADKARVVIDTTSPVAIETAEMEAESGGGVRLRLALAEIDASDFGNGTGAQRAREQASAAAAARTGPAKATKSASAKPLVYIDPGHGGIDPGAVGASNVYEKNVVLAVGLVLRDRLLSRGSYEVRMTREDDVFLSLDKRVALSEEAGADLFISLHADAIADRRFVSQVRGATVYTLSERASDETARQMAEKENNADAIAGLPSMDVKADEDVRDILIDLVKRETANFAADFSNTLVGRLEESVRLSSKPQRSAAFKVLRQTGTPSVLVELGYLSNPQDEKRLTSEGWREKMAEAIAKAVDHYFDRRTALAR